MCIYSGVRLWPNSARNDVSQRSWRRMLRATAGCRRGRSLPLHSHQFAGRKALVYIDPLITCFDLFTGDIKAWCPGLDADGSAKDPYFKPLGNISKNRAPLTVFPARLDQGKIWVVLE
jgi:hypothetical protein